MRDIDIYFGAPGVEQPAALADDEDSDELLEETPQLVKDILGFDPITDEEFNADNLDWVKDPKTGQFTNTHNKTAAVWPVEGKVYNMSNKIKLMEFMDTEYATHMKAAKATMQAQLSKQAKLDKPIVDTVAWYTSFEPPNSRNLTEYMRTGKVAKGHTEAEMQQRVQHLTKWVENKPLPVNLRLYRGMELPAAIADKLKVGAVVHNTQFSSFSANSVVAKKFMTLNNKPAAGKRSVLLQLDAPKGSKFAPVISAYTYTMSTGKVENRMHWNISEGEFLGMRNMSFKITGVKNITSAHSGDYMLVNIALLQSVAKADDIINVDWVKDPKTGQFTGTPGGAKGGTEKKGKIGKAPDREIEVKGKVDKIKNADGFRDYMRDNDYNSKLRDVASTMSKSPKSKQLIEAMSDYVSTGYISINNHLRGKEPVGLEGKAELEAKVKAIDGWIKDNPLKTNLRMYRGMYIGSDTELKPGKVIKSPTFSSFSANKTTAKQFSKHAGTDKNKREVLLEIDAPKGAPFAPAFGMIGAVGSSQKSVGWNSREMEFLGSPGMRFKILDSSVDAGGLTHVKVALLEG